MVKTLQKDDESVCPLMMSSESESPIAEFYRDRSLLMTGATGFVGKVLLEKLLRSCPGVKNIYVLIRPKDGQDPRQRLDETLKQEPFEKLRRLNSNIFTKVIPVVGDLTRPDLGLSQSDITLVANSVSVVFHSAATVRFDDPFKYSLEINVIGTKRVVDLCHKLPHLVALVHVSTAYCYCYNEETQEIVYTEQVPPQKLIDATDWMSEDLMNSVGPHMYAGRPTPYHYTKAQAENILIQEGGNLPVAIVRPSIITASWRDPMPGWVDNYYGISGYLVALGKGVLRTMVASGKVTIDLVPVDCVSNLLISVAWYTATKSPRNLAVYHCTSGCVNRMTWEDLQRIALPLVRRYPPMELFRYPGGGFTSNRLLNELLVIIQHNIPAYLVDFWAPMIGIKTEMRQVYKKINRASNILAYFTTREWAFPCNNTIQLVDQLRGQDKDTFCFDVRRVHWPTYMEDYILGLRRYLLKEQMSTLPTARLKLASIYFGTHTAYVVVFYAIFRILLKYSRTARHLWWSAISIMLQLIQMVSMRLMKSS